MNDGHANILVVDDEKTLREIVSRALSKLGHHCTPVENGEEALLKAASTTYDLVITDLKMPKMDGLTLVARLRADEPDLPIIIMTGYADIESARKALRLKVSDYLVKPFESLAEVQAAAQRAIDTRSSRLGADSMVDELEGKAKDYKRKECELTRSLEKAKIELEHLAMKLKKSEAVSGRQVEQIETIISNVENGIIVTDTRGAVLSLNQELRKQLQAPRFHGTGISIDRLPGDSTLREAMMMSRHVAHLDAEEPLLVETVDAQGLPRAYEVRSANVVDGNDSVVGIVTTVRAARPKVARV